MHRRLPLFTILLVLPACGLSIEASEPLVFVAPLEGTWVLETDPSTELRVSVPGGQPRFAGQFDFAADLVTPGGTTSYDGSADEELVTLRDPATGAILLDAVFLDNTMIRLSDGRIFRKAFTQDLLGVWQDVNYPTRFYIVEVQQPTAGTASGCAVDLEPRSTPVDAQGRLNVIY
jgi:hypothetical protein